MNKKPAKKNSAKNIRKSFYYLKKIIVSMYIYKPVKIEQNSQYTFYKLGVIPMHNVECFTLIKLTPRAPAPLGCSPDRYPVMDPWDDITIFWDTGLKMLREVVFLLAVEQNEKFNLNFCLKKVPFLINSKNYLQSNQHIYIKN